MAGVACARSVPQYEVVKDVALIRLEGREDEIPLAESAWCSRSSLHFVSAAGALLMSTVLAVVLPFSDRPITAFGAKPDCFWLLLRHC